MGLAVEIGQADGQHRKDTGSRHGWSAQTRHTEPTRVVLQQEQHGRGATNRARDTCPTCPYATSAHSHTHDVCGRHVLEPRWQLAMGHDEREDALVRRDTHVHVDGMKTISLATNNDKASEANHLGSNGLANGESAVLVNSHGKLEGVIVMHKARDVLADDGLKLGLASVTRLNSSTATDAIIDEDRSASRKSTLQ
eukprot:1838336-Rhodomonas_salina.2